MHCSFVSWFHPSMQVRPWRAQKPSHVRSPYLRTETSAAHSPHVLPLYPIHSSGGATPHWFGGGEGGGGGEVGGGLDGSRVGDAGDGGDGGGVEGCGGDGKELGGGGDVTQSSQEALSKALLELAPGQLGGSTT